MADQPNVLVIMTDQERYPPPYEDDAVAAYRRDRFPGRARIAQSGLEFHRHYIASSACVPSRTSLFTGQYPSLHGVRSTDGVAKTASDPGMTWLDPDTVPTMGDWFRAGGYQTHYRGKWHLSHPDLPAQNGGRGLATNDRDGNRFSAAIDAYRRANRLERFGFDGWLGREPHGADPADTGFVRDHLFAEEVEQLFSQVAADDPPWLIVASLVNPHDIAFSGAAWSMLGFPDVPQHVPAVPAAPSQDDSFANRPACHPAIRDAWTGMLYPQPTDDDYRRFYLWLHELVDGAIERILDGLDSHGFADNTIVVFTSDHGEMLGAHGGLQQKWHNAFDETTRVPFVVSGPGIHTTDSGIEAPTSHIDVLPTLLGLVGIDEAEAARRLSTDHVEVRPLVGLDHSPNLRGFGDSLQSAEPVYFMTEDHISRGLRTRSIATDIPFQSVEGAANVECIIGELDSQEGGAARELWKLVHYYERRPDEPDPGLDSPTWELHNLTLDPHERDNRASEDLAVLPTLRRALEHARDRCLLTPEPRTS